MKLDEHAGNTVVTLSRRNILALLAKLDQPGSRRSIVKRQGDTILFVVAEEDASHYEDGPGPGQMSFETERFIAANGGMPA